MMCIGLGYLVGAAIFPVIFAATMTYQIRSDRFHPAVYRMTMVATKTSVPR